MSNSNFIHGSCPNCGETWSITEMDWNRCYACGWPENEDDEFEDEDYPEDWELDEN